MAEQGLPFRSLSDLAEQIRRKDVSPVEVTRAALDRLESLNPRLNAFLTNFGEHALEAAKRAEHAIVTGQPHGALHGVPLALKDIFAIATESCRYPGRSTMSDRSPARSATQRC